MHRLVLLLASLLLTLAACSGVEGIDPVTGEGVEVARQSLFVDDVYANLRAGENLLPLPPPQATVDMGTLDCATGTFSGLVSTVSLFNGKPIKTPPMRTINGINAELSFNATCTPVSVTVGGVTVTSNTTNVRFNAGIATRVDWSLRAGTASYADAIQLSRPTAFGAGAFTLTVLPISVVYEPPMNLALTNRATQQFREEMTTITTVSSGSSTATTRPTWGTMQVAGTVLQRLASGAPTNVAGVWAQTALALIGSTDGSTTTGTTVNSDSTLGLSQVTQAQFTTNARLGPGRGDLVVFYKNARVMWVMEQGRVSLALLDHGPLASITVEALKSDLLSVQAGGAAVVTGLDATSLQGLLSLDPSVQLTAKGSLSSTLPARFMRESDVLLNGTSYSSSLSHTVTSAEKTSTTNVRTSVTNNHPGWLSLVGIGFDASSTTTTLTMGTSRTDLVSSTVSATFDLSAAANESYQVQVFYDSVFGTFLTRKPPAQLSLLSL